MARCQTPNWPLQEVKSGWLCLWPPVPRKVKLAEDDMFQDWDELICSTYFLIPKFQMGWSYSLPMPLQILANPFNRCYMSQNDGAKFRRWWYAFFYSFHVLDLSTLIIGVYLWLGDSISLSKLLWYCDFGIVKLVGYGLSAAWVQEYLELKLLNETPNPKVRKLPWPHCPSIPSGRTVGHT